jgi:hypothetical protein
MTPSESPNAPANRFAWSTRGSPGERAVQQFLLVAERQLAWAGGGAAELAVIAWLRGIVPLTASELDRHRWPPTVVLPEAGVAGSPGRGRWARDRRIWGDPVDDYPPERDGR